MINKAVLKEKFEIAFGNFKTAIQAHSDINCKRADGGWSVAEIANHIVKSTSVNLGAVKQTERSYDQHAASIRDLFLNFNLKFHAAPELQPDARQYSKQELFSSLDANKKKIFSMIDGDELAETCVDIALPVWGNLTKYEWLVLFEHHIIRHARQIQEFEPARNKDYWNSLYHKNETGWDIGYPSPAITSYINQLGNNQYSVLVPGCGNSYEAEYLLQKGFTNITLLDIAPLLTKTLEEKFRHHINNEVKIITGNFFNHEGKYDLIIEQTFLSALHPSLRNEYARKMWSLLKPGGRLVGVLFDKHFDNNPPYGGNAKEYTDLFSGYFDIKILAPCYNSIERRSGSEVFINLKATRNNSV